MRIQSWDCNH